MLPDGITKKESHYAQTIARNPDVVEKVKEKARKKGELPTAPEVIKEVKKEQKKKEIEEATAQIKSGLEWPGLIITQQKQFRLPGLAGGNVLNVVILVQARSESARFKIVHCGRFGLAKIRAEKRKFFLRNGAIRWLNN